MFSAIAERRGPARRRFWSRLLERAPPPEAWLIAKAFASGDGGQLDAERNDLLKQGKRYRSHANSRIGWLAPGLCRKLLAAIRPRRCARVRSGVRLLPVVGVTDDANLHKSAP